MRVRLFFLFLLICGFIYAQEKRLALVIGNANYDKGALKNPVNDAFLMKETLMSLGFDVILDTNLCTRNDLLKSINSFGERRKNYHVGFVYYAGHGVQIDGNNYILPTKEKYESKIDVKDNGVNVDRFIEFFEMIKNEVNILVLDACRNNPFEKNWTGSSRSLVDGLGLAPIPNSTGNIIAFSTSAGTTASDGKENAKNSSYCLSLVKNMLTVDLDLDQIFRNVRKEIREISGDKQQPTVDNQYEGSDFYFRKSTYTDQIIQIDSLIDEESFDLALEKVAFILTKSPDNKKALLRRGRIEYNRNLEYNGLHLFKADSLFPNDPEVLEYLGRYYSTIGKVEKANEIIDRAISLFPKDPNLVYWKAILCWESDNLSDAEKFFTKAITLDSSEQRFSDRAFFYENYPEFYSKAQKDYDRILELSTNKAQSHFLRGNFFKDILKEPKKALKEYNQAIILDQDNVDYLYTRGLLYSKDLENPIDAMEDWKSILKIDTLDVDAFNEIGLEYIKLGDTLSGLEWLENGIRLESINPNSSATCYANRADIYSKQGKFEEAYNDYTKAIFNSTNKSEYYFKRSEFIFNSKEDEISAMNDLNEAIRLDPSNEMYLYQRGIFYEKLKKYDLAIESFQQLLKINPDIIEAINYIGVINEQQGKTDLVIENYNKCIALENTNPNSAAYCYSNRAGIYAQQGKLTEALQDYTKAIELDNKNGDRYYTRALFYEGYLEDYDNALIDFSKAIELAPTNVNNLYQRGVLYKEALNKNKKALDDFEKILEIDSTDINALNYIGIILKDEGKYDLAIAQFEKGIALEITNPISAAYCYSNRADIYVKQAKLTKALQDYTKAIELDPKNAEHYFYRAEFNTNNLNKPYDALVDYSIGISLDSLNTFGWFQRGLLFSNELNDEKSAIRDFEYLLKLDSNDVSVLNWLGVLHGRLGEDSIEFEYYNRILQVQNPTLKENNEFKINLAWAYNNLAYMFQKENNNAKTLEYYGKAIENDPYEPLRHYERAWFNALYLGDFTSALNDINNAIKFDEKNSYWLLNRAKINLISKNYNAAKKDFNKLVENNSNSVSYTSELANFYSIINENELANFYFDKAQRIDSNSMVFLHLYTDHLIRNEIWGSAKKTAQKAISNNLHDTIGYFQLGLTYLSNKNFVNALTSFVEAENIIEFSERIEEIDESDESQLFLSDIQRKISEIYMLLGEIELSCSYTNKAIQSLNNETRSKKSEHLKLLIDMKANCRN